MGGEGSPGDISLIKTVTSVIALGVPNRGLDIRQLSTIVNGQPNQGLVTELDGNSAFLKLLNDVFECRFRASPLRTISV